MITDPIKANKILENDESDMIAMARAFLSNPRWVWDAADILGLKLKLLINMQDVLKNLFRFFFTFR